MRARAVLKVALLLGVGLGGCGGEMTMPDAGSDGGPACDDGVRNGDESDVDCGGSCAPCDEGSMCGGPDDCQSGRCVGGTCQPPLAATGEPCSANDECASGTCRAFGDRSICTEPCTTTCPGEMLACFDGTCTPRDYCENPDGIGDGPGCTGTICDACATTATCVELGEGGYACMCNEGYSGDGRTCTDIDECALGTHDCGEHASCMNTDGSFTCTCDAGYEGDGRTCTDIDECAAGTHTCGVGADCTNTEGSFICSCPPGYEGDGMTCTDIDECAAGTHTCHADATCINDDGHYDCRCNPGFVGDGRTCTPATIRFVAWIGDTAEDGRTDLVVVGLPGAPFTTPTIVSPITTFGDVPTSASFTQFSPDGTKIAFRGDFAVDGVDELWLVDLSGSAPSVAQRVNGPLVTNGDVVNFAWSPDSTRIVYSADQDTDAVTELYLVDVSGPTPSTPVKISGPMVSGGSVQSGSFDWSPDGSRIAYRADQLVDNVIELFVVDVSGPVPGPPQRVNGPLPDGADTESRWVWTPDGRRIIYQADQDTLDVLEIYMVDVSGPTPSTPVKLNGPLVTGGDVGTTATDVAVSFDGRWVSYVADQNTDNVEEVFVVDISGGAPSAPIRVSGPPSSFTDNINVSWSPTANRLMYASDQEASNVYEVYYVDLTSGVPTPALKIHPPFPSFGRLAAGAAALQWSPDGRWFAYRADTAVDNAFEVEVVDMSTGTPGPPFDASLPRTPGLTTDEFAFAPDSSAIAVRGEGLVDNADEVFVTDLTSPTPTPVSITGTPTAAGGQALDFLWVGDSRHILVRGDFDTDGVFAAYLIDRTAPVIPPPATSAPHVAGGIVNTIIAQ